MSVSTSKDTESGAHRLLLKQDLGVQVASLPSKAIGGLSKHSSTPLKPSVK